MALFFLFFLALLQLEQSRCFLRSIPTSLLPQRPLFTSVNDERTEKQFFDSMNVNANGNHNNRRRQPSSADDQGLSRGNGGRVYSNNHSNREASYNDNKGNQNINRGMYNLESSCEDLDVESQKLLSSLEDVASNRNYNDLAQRLKNIASRSDSRPFARNARLNLIFANHVAKVLEPIADKMDSNDATNALWSMGRLGFRFHNQQHRRVALRLLGQLCNESCTARQVTTSLGGLARINMRYTQLDEENQSVLVNMISTVAALVNDREICNMMHSVSKIGIPWSRFPRNTQDNLLNSIIRERDGLQGQQGAMTLYSLGNVGMDISYATPAIRDNLYIIMSSVLEDALKRDKSFLRSADGRYIAQQVSNAIYGFAKLGVSYQEIPTNLLKKIEDTLIHLMPYMNEQEVSNTVYSHGIMGCSWLNEDKDNTDNSNTCMTLPLKEVLRSNIIRSIGSMVPQGVSNTLYGMSLMGANWEEMGVDYQYGVLEAVIRSLGTPRYGEEQNNNQGHNRNNYNRQTGNTSNRYGSNVSPQAVANIIYSLGVCGASWQSFPPQVKSAIRQGLVDYGNELSSQEISNVIYGLGSLRACFSNLDKSIVDVLTEQLDRVATQTKTIPNSDINGGSMNGSGRRKEATNPRFESVSGTRVSESTGSMSYMGLNEQEVCATLHGFAKMDADWNMLPEALRYTMLNCIHNLAKMGNLCLACSVYSLGILGAHWKGLPTGIRNLLLQSALSSRLSDQTIANVVYGLSLLEANWDKLDKGWNQLIIHSLSQKDCFTDIVPQHIANTLWGLAKLDATWQNLPKENLESAFIMCKDRFNCQETSNIFYGLGLMDVRWDDLSLEFRRGLYDAVIRTSDKMTVQEVANVMYSLTLVSYDSISYTYDSTCGSSYIDKVSGMSIGSGDGISTGNAHIDNSVSNYHSMTYIMSTAEKRIIYEEKIDTSQSQYKYAVIDKGHTDQSNNRGREGNSIDLVADTLINPRHTTITTTTPLPHKSGKNTLSSNELLWKLHEAVLKVFSRINVDEYCKENYDQFAMYFEMMRTIEGGNELVEKVLGRIPRTSGPCATIPSRLHASVIAAMLDTLNENGGTEFTVVHEFIGLHGVMPIDAAVYHGNRLIALVEIDGEFHYKGDNKGILRRKDHYKTFLYSLHFPQVPMFRVRSDQCKAVGIEMAANALASWIRSRVPIDAKTNTEVSTTTRKRTTKAISKASATKTATKRKAATTTKTVAKSVAKKKTTTITSALNGGADGVVKRPRGRPRKNPIPEE